MKKLITGGVLASALLVSSANADSKWYAGIEVGKGSNKTTVKDSSDEIKEDNNYKDLKFVVGKGTGDNFYVQAYLSSITFDEKPWFSEKDKATELGIEIIKQFKMHEKVYPFLKAGIGFASMKTTDDFVDSNINAGSFTLGAGVDFKATENISIIAGADLNFKKWQDVEVKTHHNGWISYTSTETFETSDKSTRLYLGLNYRF
ncbi:hypothetical protein AAX26_00237 [Aliarcobacter thereius]|uniref:Porin family protein n=1 Tax=Aliarcobacter thereius TaxID=544718 RepID=A0A5R9HCQ8_9BACT|nr:outer membrane beta-barrel protein [Aliarcobacter thereius]OCL88556.1 hypothetical protein AAX26_00237 [Aliarcobacter thereius]TLS72509.1 porin family protein [Aliarcobacter thereius]